MFSGLASFLPSWPGARQPTTVSVAMDLERGDGNRSRMDDDRLSSVSSFRANSHASSTTDTNQETSLPDFPQDELDNDNDVSTSGCGVGPSSEESVPTGVPGFLSALGRSASTPPEILRVNPPPDSLQRQLQDQDHIHSSTSSSSSASSTHSYARFFHRVRTPKRPRSSLSLGPGGIHGGLSVLSPIYEPPNPDSRGSDSMQKGGKVGESSMSKETQAPSIHSTTSTIQERIMSLQATHPAFLKRPVRRTISQTSSNLLHSEISGAPQLPPLHFRPAFTGISVTIITPSPVPSSGPPSSCRAPHPPTVVVPTRPSPSNTSPQRSQLSSQPNTPQSLTTPRSHRFGFMDHSQKCSAIYEDNASEKSFVTARSGETEPGPGVITKHDIPSTADLIIYPHDQEQTEESEHVEEHGQGVPSGSKGGGLMLEPPRTEQFSGSETAFNLAPDLEKRFSTVHATLPKPKGVGRASVMSIASTTVKNESMIGDDGIVEETATVVEDDQFITERWMKTLFYSASGVKEHFWTAKGERKQSPVSSACVLFWVGFIAPWCWLVGGWMPPRNALSHENDMKGGKLKVKVKVSVDVDGETVSEGQEGGGLKKWVLPDPSSSFKVTRAPSVSSTTALCPKEVEEARTVAADPWVRRCRIASIVGGTVLGLGLIAMVVVLTVVKE